MRFRLTIIFLLLPATGFAHGQDLVISFFAGQGIGVLIACMIACLPNVRGIGRALAIILAIISCVAAWMSTILEHSSLESVGYSNRPMFLLGIVPPLVAAGLSYFAFRKRSESQDAS